MPSAYGGRADSLTEFLIVVDQVERNAERFIARLNRNIKRVGDCRLWQGGSISGRNGGNYRSTSFVYRGKQYMVYVHRLFLVMMLRHPIPKGYHVGHDHAICKNSNCVFHLFLEESKQNVRESAERRWARG